jgi:glycosyltransferase involved in cell wall biosynthesis
MPATTSESENASRVLYDSINIMCPTFGRSHNKLPRMIQSALKTASRPDRLRFTFMLHEGDEDSRKVVEQLVPEKQRDILWENRETPHLAIFYNRMYAETRFQEIGTLVSMIGDDMIFESGGWDTEVLRVANDYDGICVIHGDDCFCWHDRCCINLFSTRRYVDAMAPHPFMCPEFPCDGMDVVQHEIGNRVGRRVYLPAVKIRHDHATAGVHDRTYTRLREQFPVSAAFAPKQYDYAEECAQNIRAALGNELSCDGLRVMMTTYNRPRLLKRTVDSYNASWSLPEKITVFDDCSSDLNVVKHIRQLPGADIRIGAKRLRCIQKVPDCLRQLFDEGADAVFVIDSDTLFAPSWWEKVKTVYRRYRNEPWFGIVGLFNMRDQEVSEFSPVEGLVEKPAIGGFGVLITRKVYDECIAPFEDSRKNDGWDNKMCTVARENWYRILVTAPSYLQHTGHAEGTHVGDAITYATDFLGVEHFDVQFARGGAQNARPDSIVWSLLARAGDVVQGSMIANYLVENGWHLTWVVLEAYRELAYHVCPGAKIVSIDSPNPMWHGLTTAELKEKWPDKRYYINAQFGCAENHNTYIASGLHPLEWLSQRVESILSMDVTREWLKYLRLGSDRSVDLRQWNREQPLALIFPEAKTSQALTQKGVNEEFSRLVSQGYYTRIVLPKRPPNLGIREVRERYMYGFTMVDLPHLMQEASVVVANDSFPAWAALYSHCELRVFHKASRVEKTNTYFSQLTDRAEDIILEDQ